ncbi:MAG: PAS domain S-box protein [Anaerolineae bacterium]|nr:PAS domain S-box protein [Anaerolineae bacterium]
MQNETLVQGVAARKQPPVKPYLLVVLYTLLTIGFGFILVNTDWSDSLMIVLVAPIIWAALYYRRRYCWMMLTALATTSIWIISQHSDLFQSALSTIYITVPTLVFIVMIVHHIIRQRDRYEQALETAKEEYRIIADFSFHLVFWTNPDGTFRYISPSCEQVTGYPAKTFLENRELFYALLPPEDLKRVFLIDDTQQAVQTVEFQFTRKDGAVRYASLVSRPVHSALGVYLGRRGTILDVTEQHNMEAALQMSNERLRLSIEENEGGIWDWDIPSSRITFSPEYARLLGMRREQVRYLKRDDAEMLRPAMLRERVVEHPTGDFYSLIHPEDIGGVLENLHAYVSGKLNRYEVAYRIHTRDGQWVWMLDRASIYQRDDAGQPTRIIGIHINITERKNIEQALQLSETMFRQISESIREVFFIIERDTTEVIYISPNVAEIASISAETLIQMQSSIVSLFLLEEQPQAIEMFNEIIEQGHVVWRELRFRYSDGSIGWLQVRGYPIHSEIGKFTRIVFVVEDITQNKAAEAALRDSEQRYRELIEQQGEGVLIADTSECVVYANPAAGGIFGVAHTKLVGRSLKDFFDEEQFRILLSQTAIRRNGRESSFELNLLRPDGEMRTILVTATPRFDQDGNFIASIEVFRDITERKADEEKLRYLSSHDALTDVFNRAYFENTTDQLETGGNFPVSVIMIDLDGLKGINDEHGHHIGDELLQSFSTLMKQVVRDEDVIARLGGDEFAILMPGVDEANLKRILARLKDQVDRFNKRQRQPYTIQFSAGGATSLEPATLRETLRDADLNMYHAKRKRKRQTA